MSQANHLHISITIMDISRIYHISYGYDIYIVMECHGYIHNSPMHFRCTGFSDVRFGDLTSTIPTTWGDPFCTWRTGIGVGKCPQIGPIPLQLLLRTRMMNVLHRPSSPWSYCGAGGSVFHCFFLAKLAFKVTLGHFRSFSIAFGNLT